jgi:hypothetical protein
MSGVVSVEMSSHSTPMLFEMTSSSRVDEMQAAMQLHHSSLAECKRCTGWSIKIWHEACIKFSNLYRETQHAQMDCNVDAAAADTAEGDS